MIERIITSSSLVSVSESESSDEGSDLVMTQRSSGIVYFAITAGLCTVFQRLRRAVWDSAEQVLERRASASRLAGSYKGTLSLDSSMATERLSQIIDRISGMARQRCILEGSIKCGREIVSSLILPLWSPRSTRTRGVLCKGLCLIKHAQTRHDHVYQLFHHEPSQ